MPGARALVHRRPSIGSSVRGPMLAGMKRRVAHDGGEQRGLADAVAAEHRERAALGQLEVDVLEHHRLAVAGAHACELSASAMAPARRGRPACTRWSRAISLGRAFDQHLALHQHGDAPREAEHEVHVVLDDQDGDVGRQLFERCERSSPIRARARPPRARRAAAPSASGRARWRSPPGAACRRAGRRRARRRRRRGRAWRAGRRFRR